jgi:hypothetical protein
MPVPYCNSCGQAPAVTSEGECAVCYEGLMKKFKKFSSSEPEEQPVYKLETKAEE